MNRKAAWWVLGVAMVALLLLAWWRVPWDWTPGGSLTPAKASDIFTRTEIRRAEDYARGVRYVAWAAYAVSLVVSLVLGLTPLGARLVERLGSRRRWWLTVLVGTLVLLVIGRLVTLPFALVLRARRLDAGLTHQGLGGWFQDFGTGLLVSWVITTLLLLVVVGAARRSPRYWFAWAGGAAAVLTFVGSLLYPVVVEPLFNSFTPMPDGTLRTSILELADKEGVHIEDVLVADASRRTTTLNAYVSGFGDTRRIVVYDNLLADLPPAEIRSVIAHELGHAKHDDVLLGTALGALGALAAVCAGALVVDSRWLRRRAGYDGPGDPRSIAALLAVVAAGTFLVSPAQNAVSRAIEARADREALINTGDVNAFLEVQRQLALRSLADPSPPWLSQLWWGTHPTALQRVGLARWYEETRR